jgi:Phosphatase
VNSGVEGSGYVIERSQLAEHLVESRIAGQVATRRESNLGNYRRMSERHPGYLFGLELSGHWSPAEVLALMAARCGVSPDPEHREGGDTIDPERTLDRLDDLADRLRQAADRQERVLLATGHPEGLLGVYQEIATALAAAGCPLLTPAAGWPCEALGRDGRPEPQEIRYVGPVAVVAGGDALKHTHSPGPMRAMITELTQAGQSLPDLVVADHGWAGAAGEAGADVVGFADSNDPALFVAEAEGKAQVVVPLDDNVSPHLYAPLTSYVLQRADLRNDRPTDLLFPTSTTGH